MELEARLKHYRISQTEYVKIKSLLGREPQGVEWALFSALWSEHCSYKSSKVHLRKLFNESERLLTEEGENAGVLDLGEGEKIAFKMESHNHPSFIEPYEGAATGVGGILRDIFTMGARPVMLANYLCFGEPKADRMAQLVDGVVRGIGGYGNCVGVPTITGQVEFHRSYNKNILVNAFALGLFRKDDPIFTAKASGPGNLVVYVGAKTGKDGVHGASMASESFDEDTESKKPTIQKGDPFFEKLLIESCLEVMKKGLVVAIQDMGAAGLTSSSFEMSARGGVGFNLHLDRVPLRDSSLGPEEILLSESQERMLLICLPENLKELQKVFKKWDLDAEPIGEVVEDKKITLNWKGETLTQIDPSMLVDHAPRYERPYKKWQSKARTQENFKHFEAKDPKQVLLQLLGSELGTSRRWVYEQYDQRVGAKTAMDASQTLGVIRLPDSERALGLSLGCRTYVMRMDAQVGGADSILYPAFELAAKGFETVGVTDCLNFGSPENESIMSEFVASLEAMSEACRGLNAPIISGNVSFYNETLGQNITSTPATGVVGLRAHLKDIPSGQFTHSGDDVFLVRLPILESSGLVSEMHDQEVRFCGEMNIQKAVEFVKLIQKLSFNEGVRSTRLVGKFGVIYALPRMCLSGLGVEIKSTDKVSFKENFYEVLFALNPDKSSQFQAEVQESEIAGVELERLGVVKGEILKVKDQFEIPCSEIKNVYENSWEKIFGEHN